LIQFVIHKRPRPQQRHRSNGRWNYDPSAKEKKEFAMLIRQYAPDKPIEGDIDLHLTFCYKRPKAHYRKKDGELIRKKIVPYYKKSRPDIDNLSKWVMDSLGDFFLDDSQVVSLNAQKVYGSEDLIHIKIFHNKKYCKSQEKYL